MSDKPRQPASDPAESSLTLGDARETPDIHYLHAPIMREQAEPRDGREPVPLWLTVFYGAVVFWGGYYLASYNGGFQPNVYDERIIRGAQVVDAEPDPAEQGRRLFTVNCAACHQQSGQGVAGQFPPLAESEWVTGEPAILIRILLHGLQGPITVRGNVYNGNMPAFGAKLDDQQLSLVLTWIRQNWGNSAGEITPDWITQVRTSEQSRVAPWTSEELQSVQPEAAPEPAVSEPGEPSEPDAAESDPSSENGTAQPNTEAGD